MNLDDLLASPPELIPRLFTIRDGKVVRVRGFADRASALEAARLRS
jgi:hypothetical protein